MHLYTKHSTCHICNANNNYTLVFSACLKWRWTLRRIRKLYEHHTNCLWRKIEWRQKRSVSFLFEHGVSLTDHDFFQQLSLHAFLVCFMSWRNRNKLSFTEGIFFKRLLYMYIYLDVCDKKHMWDYSQTFRTNWTSPGTAAAEEEKLFMEKMRDAPLRNELGSLPSPYSNFVFPPIQNPDDFICLLFTSIQYILEKGINRTLPIAIQCTRGTVLLFLMHHS